MVGNIGIGIANAIGFKNKIIGGNSNIITYPGLIAAWSAAGKSNDDADRSVLRDLTGNGHDITLNGFAFSEMSGYGGYGTSDVNTWHQYAGAKYNIINANKIEITTTGYFTQIKINGGKCLLKFNKQYAVKAIQGCTFTTEDGYIYEVTKETETAYRVDINSEYYNIPIIVESLPLYPDALVFDGVDDYNSAVDFGGIEIGTVIMKCQKIDTKNFYCYFGNVGDFVGKAFRLNNSSPDEEVDIKIASFDNNIYIYNSNTRKQTFSTGWRSAPFSINGKGLNEFSESGAFVFYSAYLFDRSLDEQEIKAFIRKYIDADYLLPSEIPTPDCYYDFTSGDNASETRDTIVDLSGNGNDAKAYNFAWNEEGSGYKNGALQFDGTDDYISLEAFDSGFQTILMLCNYSTSKILYDQRNDEHQFSGDARFVIFAQGNSVAYNWGNVGGVTYINGKLNSSVLANETVLKKHCICINNPTVTSEFTTTPKIGGPSTTTSTAYAKMSVFKFLGFKEALTEEQIQYVIKKYNLLDGIDEIEVS